MENFNDWVHVKLSYFTLSYFELIWNNLWYFGIDLFKMRFTCYNFFYYKMINLDNITHKNNKKRSGKWSYISDRPYRILIIGGSGSRKTNTLLNLINEQNYIDKIYLYERDLSKQKDKILIKKRKDAGIKHWIECSNTMDDVYENIHDYNPSRKRKILIIFDDMIADIMTNKRFQATIKE